MGARVASSPLDGGLPRKTDRSAPASCVFRGLLSVHSRFGLRARWITRCDPLHQRLRRTCCLLRRSDCYRLERPVAGWDLHPLEVDAFARRTVFGHYGVEDDISRLYSDPPHADSTGTYYGILTVPIPRLTIAAEDSQSIQQGGDDGLLSRSRSKIPKIDD